MASQKEDAANALIDSLFPESEDEGDELNEQAEETIAEETSEEQSAAENATESAGVGAKDSKVEGDVKPEDGETDTWTDYFGEEDKPDNYKKLIELEKRRRDSQATYNKEHEELIGLKAKLELFESNTATATAAPAETAAKPDDGEWDRQIEEAFEDDPAKAFKMLQKKMVEVTNDAKKIAQEEVERFQNQQIASQEVSFKKDHPDYDEVIKENFAPAFESNPAIRERWEKDGRSVEAAYKIGKEIKDYRAHLENPEALKEQMRKQILAEMEKEKPNSKGGAATLSGVTSKKTGETSGKKEQTIDDVINEVALYGN